MIRYQLICGNDHEFEGWFANSGAFDTQRAADHVSCPQCGSTNVTKALMAPNISVKTRQRDDSATTTVAPSPQDDQSAASVGYMPNAEHIEVLRKLREHVTENAEYVGPRFAEEARKIHHEETEARGIFGEATIAEAKDLLEDGIDVCPLPKLPEDNN